MSKKLLFTFISLLLFFSQQSFANSKSHSRAFAKWKKSFINRSVKKGLPRKFLKKELKGIVYNPKIIQKDRNQITSNKKVNYSKWMKKWLGPKPNRIDKGRSMLKKHAVLLNKIEKKYKVDKEAIVSLWGVETLYGRITGNHPIIPALSSLAYDKRRRKFFEKELFSALKIVHQGHISSDKFLGSWAGALGQCQFMPSSFMMYAQDFDGDGKKDIWNNHADIFASMAYYLKRAKWKHKKVIGQLALETKSKKFNHKHRRSPAQFNKLGVRKLDGSKLYGYWKRRVVKIPFQGSPILLRGTNYNSLMRWNRSSLFAALNIVLMDAFRN
jgi:membrane-bound lytic murein transglycosylase B